MNSFPHIVIVESNGNGLTLIRTAKAMGLYVTFIRSEQYEFYYSHGNNLPQIIYEADNLIEVKENLFDPDYLFCEVSKISKKRAIDYLITVFEPCVYSVSVVAKKLNIPFTNPDSVLIARDKSLTRNLLRENNIGSVDYLACDNINDIINNANPDMFPAVLKPKSGTTSLLAKIYKSKSDLIADSEYLKGIINGLSSSLAYYLKNGFLLEEYVSGKMLSLEIMARNGVFTPIAYCERRRSVYNETIELGSITPTSLTSHDKDVILSYCISVLSAMNFDLGIFHVEIIYGDAGPILLEVNPRIAGGLGPELIKHSYGIDMYELLLKLLLNKPIEPFDKKKINSFTASYPLISQVEHICPDDFSLSWTTEFKENLMDLCLYFKPGEKISGVDLGIEDVGYILVHADSYDYTYDIVNSIVEKLSKSLECPLLT